MQLTRHGLAVLLGALVTTLLASLITLVPASPGQALVASSGASTRHHRAHHHRTHRHVTTHFKIATFNILGSQHTVRRGGWGPGYVRAKVTGRAIKRRRIDVIGLQEVQLDQLRVLRRHMHGYRFWPGTRLGYPGIPLQIGWRTWKFERVQSGWVRTPFDHQHRPTPWVKLRNLRTGRMVYVVDVHNSPGPRQQRSRFAATGKQVRLVRHLRSHHRPVFVVGDMNEKRGFFCRMVRRTDLWAANGGGIRHGRCHAPAHPRIDWIMGSGPIRFSRYRHDKGFGVRFSSDHDLVRARVTMRVLRRPHHHSRHHSRHHHRH